MAFLEREYKLSERRACELMGVERSSCRYECRPQRDAEIRQQLVEWARKKPRDGYRRLTVLLRRAGREVNHKRVWRLCQQMQLTVRPRRRRRLQRVRPPEALLTGRNQEWAMDFVSDATGSGARLRALTLVDGYTRECLEIEVATSIPSQRVTRVLERIGQQRGYPGRVRTDNGPEFISRRFEGWCQQKGITVVHIEPGKPVQNAHVESFHGKLRDECLNASWFANLFEARRKIAAWRKEYNEERPHSSLGYVAPAEFARRMAALQSPAAPSALPCGTDPGPESTFLSQVGVV